MGAIHASASQELGQRQLPFKPNSFEAVISHLAINDFLTCYLYLVELFWDEFKLEISPSEEQNLSFAKTMRQVTNGLTVPAFRIHLRELARITRPGGLIIFSSHCALFPARQPLGRLNPYYFELAPDQAEDFFTLEPANARLINKLNPDTALAKTISVQADRFEENLLLVGADGLVLDQSLAAAPELIPLEQRCFWTVFEEVQKLSYSKIVVLRKPA